MDTGKYFHTQNDASMFANGIHYMKPLSGWYIEKQKNGMFKLYITYYEKKA